MTKPATLTPSQAAAVLAVSATTLRRWSADFAEHLSETARGAGGHHRSYTPEDVSTLQRAGELLRAGHAPDEVNARLGIADESHQAAALATMPAIGAELQAVHVLIANLRAEVADLKQANQDQAAALEATRQEFVQLAARQSKRSKAQEAELTDMRAQLTEIRAEMNAPRPHWWERFTRK